MSRCDPEPVSYRRECIPICLLAHEASVSFSKLSGLRIFLWVGLLFYFILFLSWLSDSLQTSQLKQRLERCFEKSPRSWLLGTDGSWVMLEPPGLEAAFWESGCLGACLRQVGSGCRKRQNSLPYLFVYSTYLTSEPIHPNGV